MDAYKIHADSLKDLENEADDSCPALYYNGQLIPILPGGALFGSDNSPGGNSFNSDLQLTCLAADFGVNFDFEAFNQQTFNFPNQTGRLYRVKNTITAPNGWQVRILADDSSEGL